MSDDFRCDFGSLKNVTTTPTGGVRAPAFLTRVGVFTYRQPDGSVVRELRPQDEVFHADALASLANAPVTRLHPDEPVTSKNYRKLSVGHVAEGSVRADAAFVAADVLVQDADTVAAIENRSLREISCGYTCKVDRTPGEFNGEHYDQIQRDIRYNHVALGPSNWGRAGAEVKLRVDGGVQVLDEAPEPSPAQPKENTVMKIRFDGRTFEAGSDEHIEAVDARLDAAAAELAEAVAKADKAEARADAAIKALEDTKAELEQALSPERLDAAVAERAALIERAHKVAPELKCDGLTDAEIVRGALKGLDLEGKSDEYCKARFDAAVEYAQAAKVAPATAKAVQVFAPREDSKDNRVTNRSTFEARISGAHKESK